MLFKNRITIQCTNIRPLCCTIPKKPTILSIVNPIFLLIVILGASQVVNAQINAYVSLGVSNTVKVIDIATNTVTATINVGSEPRGVAITPDGARVYVANTESDNVSVINTTTNTVIATIGVGDAPVDIAVTPDGAQAYVSNAGSDNVSIINTGNNTVTATVVVGDNPTRLAITPNGARVYVANGLSDTVSVIATSNNTVLATIPVGTAAVDDNPVGVAITPNGTWVYVTNAFSDTVSVIATSSNTETGTISVGDLPNEIAITPDGSRAYVGNSLDDNVSVINTFDNTVIATIGVGTYPSGIAFTPDGARAYVTNNNSDNISVIDTSNDTVTNTIALEAFSEPNDIAITPFGPEIACSGFMPPFDEPLSLKKKVNGAIPVKIQLTDSDGNAVTDQDIIAHPVIKVQYGEQIYGDVPPDDGELLPLGEANNDNIFHFDPDLLQWFYNIGTQQFRNPGIYTVKVASGDPAEYQINSPNGACTQYFERLP
ncbi:MAG: beta-propeller fold lactonase family protein [Gammaproteobacteria bacterium]